MATSQLIRGFFILMTYAEKLKNPKWQKMRLEVLSRDNWTCKNCGTEKETLHVHHLSYQYGKDPWEYPLENFVTLCGSCHEDEEYFKNEVKKEIEKFYLNVGKSVQLAECIFNLTKIMASVQKEQNNG